MPDYENLPESWEEMPPRNKANYVVDKLGEFAKLKALSPMGCDAEEKARVSCEARDALQWLFASVETPAMPEQERGDDA